MAFAGPQPHGDELARLRAEVERLRAEAEHQRQKAKSFFERLEGTLAEFEEYKNQAHRETEGAKEEAKRGLLLKFLDVGDSLDHAIELAGGDEALHEGLVHIQRQVRAILEREGVKRIETEGHAFRADHHEVVMREVTEEYQDGMVIKEIAKGYTFRGRVLRKAKVKVAARRTE